MMFFVLYVCIYLLPQRDTKVHKGTQRENVSFTLTLCALRLLCVLCG
jgi:hypothetical protein